MQSSPTSEAAAATATKGKTAMCDDTIIGDGGNVTVYERPDGSRYSLDKRGVGTEWPADGQVFGHARFDSRELASGTWTNSRCLPEKPEEVEVSVSRARRRGSRFRTA